MPASSHNAAPVRSSYDPGEEGTSAVSENARLIGQSSAEHSRVAAPYAPRRANRLAFAMGDLAFRESPGPQRETSEVANKPRAT